MLYEHHSPGLTRAWPGATHYRHPRPLELHHVVKLPLPILLAVTPPQMLNHPVNFIPGLPFLDQHRLWGLFRRTHIAWPRLVWLQLVKMKRIREQLPMFRQIQRGCRFSYSLYVKRAGLREFKMLVTRDQTFISTKPSFLTNLNLHCLVSVLSH